MTAADAIHTLNFLDGRVVMHCADCLDAMALVMASRDERARAIEIIKASGKAKGNGDLPLFGHAGLRKGLG